MPNYTFDNTTFASLGFMEYEADWVNIPYELLAPPEQDVMTCFFGEATGKPLQFNEEGESSYEGFNIDWKKVLLVRAQKATGSWEKVIEPTLHRTAEGGLTINLAENTFPVLVETSERKLGSRVTKENVLISGNLVCGGISFADKAIAKTCKVGEKEQEQEFDFHGCWLEFSNPESENTFRIAVRLQFTVKDEKHIPSRANLEAAFRNGTLAEFLKEPSSGSEAVPLASLKVGEYKVVAYEDKKSQYGPTWIFELEDGTKVWSAGNINAQMSDLQTCRPAVDSALKEGKPVTLKFASVETAKNGKNYVNATLLLREPKVLATA